jgi:multidrug efflux pump
MSGRFNLSTWSLIQHQLVRYILIVLVLLGAWSYYKLGQAEDPAFTWRVMVVRTYWPGATAHDVEQFVSKVIEKKLQETPYLDFIDGESKPGEALLFVSVREGAPAGEAARTFYQVRKKIADIKEQLPPGVLGPYFDDEFGDVFGSVYALTGEGYTAAQLKQYADLTRDELLRLSQVAKVNLVGAQPERIYIEFDNEKLLGAGLDALIVVDALRKQNVIAAPASIETSNNSLHTRVSGEFRSLEAIRDLSVNFQGRNLRLGDVARVVRGYQELNPFKMRVFGQPAVGLEVSMRSGGDVLQLGQQLIAAVDAVRERLPVGMEIHQIADQPGVVRDAVQVFMRSLLEALLIVMAVSFVSLGKRAGLVVSLSIPLVLAMTFTGMVIFGIDLQRVSLGALIIALGLLVDDAMIIVESMAVRMERGLHGLKAAGHAYLTTASPMLTGTLITAAGFMPVGLAKSDAGEYTFSMFAVIAIALLSSWVVAVFFTPYLAFLLLKPALSDDQRDLYLTPRYRSFRKMVAWCVDHRKTVIAATLVLFVLSVVGLGLLKQQFFPLSERTEIVVDLWLPAGSSTAAVEREVTRLEQKIKGDPGIKVLASYVGGGPPHFFLAMLPEQRNSNYASVVVSAVDVPQRDRLYDKIRTALREEFPAVRSRTYRFDSGPPVGLPVQFRVIGEDPAVLRGIADRMADLLRAHRDTRDVYNHWNEIVKTLQLDVDQDKARALGVSSQDIGNTVSGMMNGLPVTQYREGDQLIDVVTRSRDGADRSLTALGDLAVRTGTGRYVPLDQFVTIRYGFEEAVLGRRNGMAAITVRADIADAAEGPEVGKQIEPAMMALNKTLPPGYRIETGGTLEAVTKSQQSLGVVVPLMVLVIVTLLMLQMRSFKSAARVLISAPLGLVGVVASLLVFRQPFGFVAILGVTALAGIIMRNSVILVELIDRFIETTNDPRRAIIEAAVRRVRPIMLTAAATILAMVPLTQAVFWRPMAVAMMGGVAIATLLTLVFEPAIYAAWFNVSRSRATRALKRKKPRRDPIEFAQTQFGPE